MKPIFKLSVGLMCLAVTFAVGFNARHSFWDSQTNLVAVAQAQEDHENGRARRCSARTLRGSYGIKFEGLSLERGPIASVSRITFDGVGQFTTSEVGRLNGQPIKRTFSGPYTVNADCTGRLEFPSDITVPPHDAHGELVIVDGGKEFFVLDDEDGWVASGIGKRL